MKKQKGITLIALIITIIVMLILVGVSVTVALNGGLFETAQSAVDKTKVEEEREQLLSIALGALNDEGIVDYDKLEIALGTDFSGEDGIYTSIKTGKTYSVSERGSITEKKYITIVPATYDVGDRVTIGNEGFYVISNTSNTVALLSEYNIKTSDGTNWIQDTDGGINPCAFSSTITNVTNGDLNKDPTIKADQSSAVYKAMQYGNKFQIVGVEGRLMTLEEVIELADLEEDYPAGESLQNCNTNGNGFVLSVNGRQLAYWLSQGVWYIDDNLVWCVDSERNLKRPLCGERHCMWNSTSFRNFKVCNQT